MSNSSKVENENKADSSRDIKKKFTDLGHGIGMHHPEGGSPVLGFGPDSVDSSLNQNLSKLYLHIKNQDLRGKVSAHTTNKIRNFKKSADSLIKFLPKHIEKAKKINDPSSIPAHSLYLDLCEALKSDLSIQLAIGSEVSHVIAILKKRGFDIVKSETGYQLVCDEIVELSAKINLIYDEEMKLNLYDLVCNFLKR